jgi:hypothetical protein
MSKQEHRDARRIDEGVSARYTEAIESAHEDARARSRPTVRLIDRLLAHPRPDTSIEKIYAGMVHDSFRHRDERCSLAIPGCGLDTFAQARGLYPNVN